MSTLRLREGRKVNVDWVPFVLHVLEMIPPGSASITALPCQGLEQTGDF